MKLKEENKKKLELNMMKEAKSQKIRDKNEELIQNRKDEILAKIRRNEENTKHMQFEKKKYNAKLAEENQEKRLQREQQIQKVAEEQQNKRDQTLNEINEKTFKIQEFKRQKEVLNEQKRIMTDEMARRKEEYSGKFQKIFGGNNFNEKTIRNIQNMFPGDQKINQLLDDYYSAIDSQTPNANSTYNENGWRKMRKGSSFYKDKSQSISKNNIETPFEMFMQNEYKNMDKNSPRSEDSFNPDNNDWFDEF